MENIIIISKKSENLVIRNIVATFLLCVAVGAVWSSFYYPIFSDIMTIIAFIFALLAGLLFSRTKMYNHLNVIDEEGKITPIPRMQPWTDLDYLANADEKTLMESLKGRYVIRVPGLDNDVSLVIIWEIYEAIIKQQREITLKEKSKYLKNGIEIFNFS